MVTRVQVLRRPLLRQGVTAKIKDCPPKTSTRSPRHFVLHSLTSSRLSREEREAAYLKARERIFGKDEKAGDATPGMEPVL